MHIFAYLHINAFIMMISFFFRCIFYSLCFLLLHRTYKLVVTLHKRLNVSCTFISKPPFDILNFHIVFFGLNTK